MSVRRKIAALGALASTAVVMGAGVASAAPQPEQPQQRTQPDAAPIENTGAPFGQVDVDVPVGFADTGATQFGSPAAPQKDAPVLGIGGGGGEPPKMPEMPKPQPTPPLPLPEPKPEPTPAPDQGKDKDKSPDKPGPEFPSPLGAVGGPAASAGGMAFKGATETVSSKAQGLPAGQATPKLPLGGGSPLGPLGGAL